MSLSNRSERLSSTLVIDHLGKNTHAITATIPMHKADEDDAASTAYLAAFPDFIEQKYQELLDNGTHITTAATYGQWHRFVPFPLSSYYYFHDHKKIKDNYAPVNSISKLTAVHSYVAFMRQYNLLYYKLLQASAANDADKIVYLQEIRRLLAGNTLLLAAGVNLHHVSDVVKKPNFTQALLAYCALNVVLSLDEQVSLPLRRDVITLLHNHFTPATLASAFQEFAQGFEIEVTAEKELLELLPDKFRCTEAAVSSPAATFIDNVIIKKLFNFTKQKTTLASSIATLIDQYPQEATQTLLSLLRLNTYVCPEKIDKATIVTAILTWHTRDDKQFNQLLGPEASFRNAGQSPLDIESWTREKTGLPLPLLRQYIDMPELASLPTAGARLLLLKYVCRQIELERQMMVMRKAAMRVDKQNDPYGYFAALDICPSTISEDFDAILDSHYKIKTTTLNPEDLKHVYELNQLTKAYDNLKCPVKRANYYNLQQQHYHAESRDNSQRNASDCPRRFRST